MQFVKIPWKIRQNNENNWNEIKIWAWPVCNLVNLYEKYVRPTKTTEMKSKFGHDPYAICIIYMKNTSNNKNNWDEIKIRAWPVCNLYNFHEKYVKTEIKSKFGHDPYAICIISMKNTWKQRKQLGWNLKSGMTRMQFV